MDSVFLSLYQPSCLLIYLSMCFCLSMSVYHFVCIPEKIWKIFPLRWFDLQCSSKLENERRRVCGRLRYFILPGLTLYIWNPYDPEKIFFYLVLLLMTWFAWLLQTRTRGIAVLALFTYIFSWVTPSSCLVRVYTLWLPPSLFSITPALPLYFYLTLSLHSIYQFLPDLQSVHSTPPLHHNTPLPEGHDQPTW